MVPPWIRGGVVVLLVPTRIFAGGWVPGLVKIKSTMVFLELLSAIFWKFSDQICKNFALRAVRNCKLSQHQGLIHQKGPFLKTPIQLLWHLLT